MSAGEHEDAARELLAETLGADRWEALSSGVNLSRFTTPDGVDVAAVERFTRALDKPERRRDFGAWVRRPPRGNKLDPETEADRRFGARDETTGVRTGAPSRPPAGRPVGGKGRAEAARRFGGGAT